MRNRHQGCRRPACRLGVEPLEGRLLLSGDMVLRWNAIMLGSLRAAFASSGLDFRPLTRAAAVVQAAVYDAVNSIDQSYTPYLALIPAPAGASEDAAAAQAAHDTLVGLFPTQALTLDLDLKASLQGINDGDAKTAGIMVGQIAAQNILAARANDGSDKTVTYTPGTDPGQWQPTPPAYAAAINPQWPMVTPFCLQSASQFRPPPPPALTSPEYTAAFNEVKDVGAFDSTTRTADQTEAAVFWQTITTPSSTPIGQWNDIAQEVAVAQNNTLVQNARLFALLNLDGADDQISCFDAKYTYNLWRPVTAIRAADTDGNPDTAADPNWTPLFPTPAHPSYPSAHATYSTSVATVLSTFFGTDAIPFSLSFEGLPGVTRSFASFSAAAHEAGLSRIWLGIHWAFDITAGEAQGQAVGTYIVQNCLLPRTSPAPRAGHGSSHLGVNSVTEAVFNMIPAATGNQALVVARGQAGTALAPGSSSPGTDGTGGDLSPLTVSQAAGDVTKNSVTYVTRAWQKAQQPAHDADVDVLFSSVDSSEGLLIGRVK